MTASPALAQLLEVRSLTAGWALFWAGCCPRAPMPSLVLAACSSTDSLLVQAACGCQWWPTKRVLAGSPLT